MHNKQECGYKGPELDSLPDHIAELVRGMMGQLPPEATVELSRRPMNSVEDATLSFDLREYAATYASDNRGLVQAVYYEGDNTFNVRIIGMLPEGTRERVMGYDKKRLDTLLTPEQSMALPGLRFAKHPWLIEGEKR